MEALGLGVFVLGFFVLVFVGMLIGKHATLLGMGILLVLAIAMSWNAGRRYNLKGAEAGIIGFAELLLIWAVAGGAVVSFFFHHPVTLDFSWLIR